jgi:hypothetical protein
VHRRRPKTPDSRSTKSVPRFRPVQGTAFSDMTQNEFNPH